MASSGKRYQCFVDICTTGLHFCHTRRDQQRCALCSDYPSYCFTSNHQKNCTNFCMELWIQSLQSTSTEGIAVQTLLENNEDKTTDIFLWLFVALLLLVFVTIIIIIICCRRKGCIKQKVQAVIRRAHLCFTVMVYGQSPQQTHCLRDPGMMHDDIEGRSDGTRRSVDRQRSVGFSHDDDGAVVNNHAETHINQDTRLEATTRYEGHEQGRDDVKLSPDDTEVKVVARYSGVRDSEALQLLTHKQQVHGNLYPTRYSRVRDPEALQPRTQKQQVHGDLYPGKSKAAWSCSTLNINSLLSAKSNEIQNLSASMITNTKATLHSEELYVRSETS